MKKIAGLSLVCFLLLGCSERDRYPLIPPFVEYDAGERMIDAGPPCMDDDFIRHRTDFRNCGGCGNQCSPSDADQCVEGSCRCGRSPACGEGADCRMGTCVRSDRFEECTTDEDCNGDETTGNQTCIANPTTNRANCVDVCEFDDACPVGYACIEGACTFLNCVPEDCDDIDNDCDGEVDENGDSTGPLSRWCYSGPNIDRINPPCRKGSQVCEIGGNWSECVGEIPPIPETGLLACNSFDDDCDGCVDGVYEDGVCRTQEPNGFDILYLIDTSGSMGTTISSVREATSRFSSIYAGNPEFRFALVIISGRSGMDRRAFVEHDFSDFVSFNTRLSRLAADGGGAEPTWDAVYESATDEIAHAVDTNSDGITDMIDESRTGLAWRDGSIRIMIMFGDEEGQTYRSDRGLPNVYEAQMCASLTHGESLTIFGDASHASDYDDCATFNTISADPDVMVGHLEDIIVDPCL